MRPYHSMNEPPAYALRCCRRLIVLRLAKSSLAFFNSPLPLQPPPLQIRLMRPSPRCVLRFHLPSRPHHAVEVCYAAEHNLSFHFGVNVTTFADSDLKASRIFLPPENTSEIEHGGTP